MNFEHDGDGNLCNKCKHKEKGCTSCEIKLAGMLLKIEKSKKKRKNKLYKTHKKESPDLSRKSILTKKERDELCVERLDERTDIVNLKYRGVDGFYKRVYLKCPDGRFSCHTYKKPISYE